MFLKAASKIKNMYYAQYKMKLITLRVGLPLVKADRGSYFHYQWFPLIFVYR